MRDHIATIVAGVVVIAVLMAAFIMLGPWHTTSNNELFVVVHDADGNEQRAALSKDTTLTVTTSLGHNVVVVEKGTAHMAEADCPHQNCVHQQPIDRPGQQIICLPHKVWVEVVGNGHEGGQMDTNAVIEQDPISADVDLVAQ